MSLAKANEAAANAKSLLADGLDPGEAAQIEKRAIQDAGTFKDLVDLWVERWAKKNRKRWEEAKKTLEYDAIPAIGKLKLRDIRRRDIIGLHDNIMDRNAPAAANRNLGLLRQVFRFAISRDLIEHSPCDAIDYPAKENPRERVLSETEIKAVWDELPEVGLSMNLQLILKFCLVTAQRRGEVINAQKSEFSDGWWTIPADRTKSGRDHRVPLSPLAKALYKEIDERSGDSEWLFPGRNGPISADHVTAKLWEVVDEFSIDKFTVHDLRRTAASHMTALGHSRFNVGKVLNHAERGVTSIYDRYGYDKEKKAALNAWARLLVKITEGSEESNVVNIS
jgi:integrase